MIPTTTPLNPRGNYKPCERLVLTCEGLRYISENKLRSPEYEFQHAMHGTGDKQ